MYRVSVPRRGALAYEAAPRLDDFERQPLIYIPVCAFVDVAEKQSHRVFGTGIQSHELVDGTSPPGLHAIPFQSDDEVSRIKHDATFGCSFVEVGCYARGKRNPIYAHPLGMSDRITGPESDVQGDDLRLLEVFRDAIVRGPDGRHQAPPTS